MATWSLLKVVSALSTTVAGGLSLLLLGTHSIHSYLERVMDRDVLIRDGRRPQYIYITDQKAKEALIEEMWDRGNGYRMTNEWVNSLGRWWKWKRRMVNWKLLEIASRSEVRSQRLAAVEALTSDTSMEDYEYRQLAQATDARTAVALARSKKADLRFFLKPRTKPLDKERLVNGLRDLLVHLHKKERHVCVKYFLVKAFPSFRTMTYDAPGIEVPGWTGSAKVSEENILQTCVESLVHHCSFKDNAKDMVQAGALPLLLSVQESLSDNKESKLLLGRLIMKISLYPEHLRDLFITGWVGVMAAWARDPDHRVSVTAASALANLDRDCSRSASYGPDVFLLHPTHRTSERVKADVVLVHGLLGGVHYTWKQRNSKEPITLFGITSSGDTLEMLASKVDSVNETSVQKFDSPQDEVEALAAEYEFVLSDIPVADTQDALSGDPSYSFPGGERGLRAGAEARGGGGGSGGGGGGLSHCWPRDWLPQDCKNLRILGINYDSRLSDWLSWCPLRDAGRSRTLEIKSKELLEQLLRSGVGRRPVVWIAHSMGGLLVKQMLIHARKSVGSREMEELVRNSKAVVFLSTPHLGSPLASLNEASKLVLLPSIEVTELSIDSPILSTLHRDFLELIREQPIQIVTFVETGNMKVTALELEIQCVPPNFGDSGVGAVYKIPLGHMDICKPDSKLSFIYQKILSVVQSVVNQINI